MVNYEVITLIECGYGYHYTYCITNIILSPKGMFLRVYLPINPSSIPSE